MTRITLDAELRSKLGDLSKPIELCDERGAVVAEITPKVDPTTLECWEPAIDQAELRRIEEENRWYTTDEVIRHLENL